VRADGAARGNRRTLAALTLVLLLAGLSPGAQPTSPTSASPAEPEDTAALATQLAQDIQALSTLPEGSRITGYPGAQAARDYIVRRLREMGIERIAFQEFPVVVPVTERVSVRVGGEEVPAYPLWPNGVRTCTIGAAPAPGAPADSPPAVLTGPVIFAGKSSFADYNGKEVPGSIVLLEDDRSVDWTNAPSFGARAVLFIEPAEPLRQELEYKMSDMPLATPRFWIPRGPGQELAQRVRAAEAQGTPLTAEISCQVTWQRRTGWNILAFLPGADATQQEHVTVLQTYYDAISIAPDLAPGAEGAGNVAALLGLAEALKAQPARRPVLLLFTAGHFESLAGMRWFCDLLALKSDKLEKEIKRLREQGIREKERLADYGALRELFSPVRGLPGDAYQQALDAIAAMERDVLTARHQRDKYEVLYDVLKNFADKPFYTSLKTGLDRYESRDRATESARLKYLRLVAHQELLQRVDPQLSDKIAFVFSLDLSSQSADLGLFHKGNFVDEFGVHVEGLLRRVFGDMAFRADDVAAEMLGTGALIDGINQPTGRVWRSYFPGPIAFESELLTLAGIPAVAFTTANDARQLVDTPVDTLERMSLPNLTRQAAAVRQLLVAGGLTQPASHQAAATNSQAAANTKVPAGRDQAPAANAPPAGGAGAEVAASHGLLNDFRTAWAIDRIRREKLLDPWVSRVVGRAVKYDPRRSLGVADVPVPGCVVVCRQNPGPYSRSDVWKSYMGVRPALMELADGAGNFEFVTVPHKRGLPWDHAQFLFEAYHLDPGTGEIDFAPNKGDQGEKLFPTDVEITVAETDVTVVAFECVPVTVFDLLDQRSYNMFATVDLYDARSDSAPFSFGYKVAGKITGVSYIEPVGVLFLPPGTPFKATFGSGVAGTKFALLGATAPDKEHYNGLGYPADEPTALINTPYLMARDIWNLDEYRLNVLRTHGVRNDKVEGLHSQAREELSRAAEALQARRYDDFVRHSRAAWGYEARAYPSVEGTTTDITTGVLFFLFLLLPVSYFAERLLFGFPDVNRQILGFFGLFLVMFFILALVHPAFGVTSGGPIILLAFITVALSVLVISMIRSRFEVELARLQQRPGQTARADLNRTNAAKQAFLLGIANMRRRKVRTSLTIATLATLMFSVLSLTSIEPKLVVKRRSIAENVLLPYQGVLIRDVSWETLTDQVYKGILNQFAGAEAARDVAGPEPAGQVASQEGRTPEAEVQSPAALPTSAAAAPRSTSPGLIAPRAWYVSQSMQEPTAVEVAAVGAPAARRSGAPNSGAPAPPRSTSGRRFIATGLVGLSPNEAQVTRPQEMLITPLTWFPPGAPDCCFLPARMAGVLGVRPEEVTGAVATAPRVLVFGQELAVLGIFDDDKLLHYTDIDGEPASPVDYQEESWQKYSEIRRDPTELYHYVHLDPRTILWVTYDFLMAHGGTLRSVAYVPADPATLGKQVEEDLLRRHTLSAFVSLAETVATPEATTGAEGRVPAQQARPVGEVVFATSVGETAIRGVGNLLVPLVISALIVLNTMLGAVYERTREIWIYGSLGLSPMHIGSLFMAESCVFASVSTVIGYLVGQVVARLITQQGLLGGLTLNYSSYSAIYSAVFTMGVVLLSTIYPARKASQLSVPDIERIWKFPQPEGDFLHFDFPFTMSGEQAVGVSMHLLHYFQDHDSQSVGDFFTADNRFWSAPGEWASASSAAARVPASPTRAPGLGGRGGHPEPVEGGSVTYHLASTVWIAPFDFGISQRLDLTTFPSDDPGILLAWMTVERLSGAPAAWLRMNHRFLKLIRKQFLVWRLFTPAERAYFINEAKQVLGLAPAAEGPLPPSGRPPEMGRGEPPGRAAALTPEPAGGD
jgi:hypothetical protein